MRYKPADSRRNPVAASVAATVAAISSTVQEVSSYGVSVGVLATTGHGVVSRTVPRESVSAQKAGFCDSSALAGGRIHQFEQADAEREQAGLVS